jgi:hypothetical protein
MPSPGVRKYWLSFWNVLLCTYTSVIDALLPNASTYIA